MPKRLTVLTPADIIEGDKTDLEPPENITGGCQKCGLCCVEWSCPLLDPVTKLCLIYEFRPYACRRYPTRDDDIKIVKCPGYVQTGL